MDMSKIKFHKWGENIRAICGQHVYDVPKNISNLGEDAIIEYVTKQIENSRDIEKKRLIFEEEIKEKPISVVTQTKDGIKLEGRIVEVRGKKQLITVELDKPEKGTRSIHYGCVSGWSGKYLFEGAGLSSDAYKTANESLIFIYNNSPKRNLVSRLNQRTK